MERHVAGVLGSDAAEARSSVHERAASMTPATVVAYHRRMAQGCRDAAAIAWAGYSSGCDDAYLGYTGYREQATEHDKMADAIEQLLPSNT